MALRFQQSLYFYLFTINILTTKQNISNGRYIPASVLVSSAFCLCRLYIWRVSHGLYRISISSLVYFSKFLSLLCLSWLSQFHPSMMSLVFLISFYFMVYNLAPSLTISIQSFSAHDNNSSCSSSYIFVSYMFQF